MQLLIEFLLQILGEYVLQIVFETFIEFGVHGIMGKLGHRQHPVVATLGYLSQGVLAGGASLFIFPHSFIVTRQMRLLNLLLTPLAAGGTMLLLGKLRQMLGQSLIRLDQFGYAFAFAFAMALTRYYFVR